MKKYFSSYRHRSCSILILFKIISLLIPHALFYGVRRKDDLHGLEKLKNIKIWSYQFLKKIVNFRGRITDLLSSLPISKNNYYCCGRESMINDVRFFLKEKGIQNKIFNEVFSMDKITVCSFYKFSEINDLKI